MRLTLLVKNRNVSAELVHSCWCSVSVSRQDINNHNTVWLYTAPVFPEKRIPTSCAICFGQNANMFFLFAQNNSAPKGLMRSPTGSMQICYKFQLSRRANAIQQEISCPLYPARYSRIQTLKIDVDGCWGFLLCSLLSRNLLCDATKLPRLH